MNRTIINSKETIPDFSGFAHAVSNVQSSDPMALYHLPDQIDHLAMCRLVKSTERLIET
jgi:hypothetical protein